MYVVADHTGRQIEKRIDGEITRDFRMPGVIWTRSHQVAGITAGVQFKRVDGPGAIFTYKFERPFQVIDLRSQSRSSEIDVTSQEGINYKALISIVFRIDREVWTKELYDEIRQRNPLLRGGERLSYTLGSFPFSHIRVRAALSTTGAINSKDDAAIVYWDQWTLTQVEEIARQVLALQPINGFWQLEGGVTNTLDKISDEIKNKAASPLRTVGIHLLSARIVNFRFPEETEGKIDLISKQQIETWKAAWERKRTETISIAEAEASRVQQEAWAYAQSLLLTSIAEGFEKAHDLYPDLPRSVIAMLFFGAIQDYISQQQPADTDQQQSTTELEARDMTVITHRSQQTGERGPRKKGE
jgi:hypothetical protein